MSGGDKKRKNTRSQGWEPAGAEFYQERYPMDAEEVMPQDPSQLATLLPSKQSRTAGTTLRLRTHDYRTGRRQTMKRDLTEHRRASGQDIMVTMPDLSQEFPNEQTTWKEIMEIKELPIRMDEKRKRKAELLSQPILRQRGVDDTKYKLKKRWIKTNKSFNEFHTKLQLWRSSLKEIEGNYGNGVLAYFLLLKWMFFLNLTIFASIFLFITVPTLVLKEDEGCNDNITEFKTNESSTPPFNVADLFQGTGIIENTALFYGYYPNEIFCYVTGSNRMYYNLPLAYLFIMILYFVMSFINMVRSAAHGFRERLVENEGQFYQYCNMIFAGWDFCIHNKKAAEIKHKALLNAITGALGTAKQEEDIKNTKRYKIVFWRIFASLITLLIWGLCGTAIYFVFNFSAYKLDNLQPEEKQFEFVFQFLPSFCIVCMNLVVPQIFKRIVNLEKYRFYDQLTITLLRSIVLRLASLIVLYYSLYKQIKGDKLVINCWETYVGQQIYKLLITDFATHIFITFFVNFPRALLAKHFNSGIVKALTEQHFELHRHVLDVFYSQTLCWFGFFYAPLLSALASIVFFLLFYIKKFACLTNSTPSVVLYRASRSNSMFMIVLLVSFLFAFIPITFSIAEMEPSKECGPFRGQESVWHLIVMLFNSTPEWIQKISYFLTTATFAVPMFVMLFLLLYYYTAITAANRHMVIVLKNQLVLEGHDKQFLLNKLKQIMGESRRKERQRTSDFIREPERNTSASN